MTVTPFVEVVAELGDPCLTQTRERLDTLQMNIIARCNLACRHCHVQGSPTRTEQMTRAMMTDCLTVFRAGGFTVIDITGGAPELHPDYRWLVDEAVAAAAVVAGKVITRCNLVILIEDGFGGLPRFWAERGVEVVASLPAWEQRNYDRQRGEGCFERALEGLRLLNEAGYGTGGTSPDGRSLTLNLVVNPGGAFLPPAQASAEREFKQHLAERGLSFDSLLTITNAPGGRFAAFLAEKGKLDAYMKRLADAFNPATVPNMMCRSQISVRWDGQVYDCDFNQAVELPIEVDDDDSGGAGGSSGRGNQGQRDSGRGDSGSTIHPLTIAETAARGLAASHAQPRTLRLADHCYACCAGAGSSCGGATA